MKFYIDASIIDIKHAIELSNRLHETFPGSEVWIDRGLRNINDVMITFYDVENLKLDYDKILNVLKHDVPDYIVIVCDNYKDKFCPAVSELKSIIIVNNEDEAMSKIKELCPLYLQEFVD